MLAISPQRDRISGARKFAASDVGEGSYIIPDGAVGVAMTPEVSAAPSVAPGQSVNVKVPHCTSEPVNVDVHET